MPYTLITTKLDIMNDKNNNRSNNSGNTNGKFIFQKIKIFLEIMKESFFTMQFCMLKSMFTLSIAFLGGLHILAIIIALAFIFAWHNKSKN